MKELTQRFGEKARIHIPVHWTYAQLIDSSMPVGGKWPEESGRGAGRLALPFVVIETGDGTIVEISSRSTASSTGTDRTGVCMPFSVSRHPPTVLVERTGDGFVVKFISQTDEAPALRQIGSIDEAIETHVQWLRQSYQARTIAERTASGELPGWLSSVPLVVTFDMWLPNGEVAHNYAHLRDFCRDLSKAGVPPGVVLYIPGWCGPYDAGYPYYEPVPELGGRVAFAEAAAAAHEAGYRIMAHTLGWGTDPYVRGFGKHREFVMRNYADPVDPPPPIVHNFQIKLPPDGSAVPKAPADDPLRGPYAGWPGGGEWFRIPGPPLVSDVDSLKRSANGWLFDSPPVPGRCEAVVSIGGLQGVKAGVVRISINGRSLWSPAGWFASHDDYVYPFTFLLAPGVNPVEITVYGAEDNAGGIGEGSVAPRGALRFAVTEMYGHNPKQNVWTQPAVGAELDDPRWHEAFCELLEPSVREFGIDLVHIDATSMWRWDESSLFAALARRLPKQTCFGTEVASDPAMGFFQLKQTRVPKKDGGAYSNVGGTDGRAPGSASGWRPQRTDFSWRLSRQYGHFYAHLCSGRGFVPHHTACSVNPLGPAFSEVEVRQIREFMQSSIDHHIVPTLRVNYRDFGLDDETKRFIEDMIINRA